MTDTSTTDDENEDDDLLIEQANAAEFEREQDRAKIAATERVARAICIAMKINPDGYTSAHRLHAGQDRVTSGGGIETLTNWQAALHIAEAAMRAMP